MGDNIKKGDESEDATTKKRRVKDEAARIRKTFEEMWALLRSSVLYFMRYEDCQHTEDRIMQAQSDLLRYGAIAEKVCHGSLVAMSTVDCSRPPTQACAHRPPPTWPSPARPRRVQPHRNPRPVL